MSSILRLFALILAHFLSACATPQSVMSGKMSCPAGDVHILETDPGLGQEHTSWRAACGDKQFICSTGPYMGKSDWLNDMSCSPAGTKTSTQNSNYLGREALAREKTGDVNQLLEDQSSPEKSSQ